MFRLEENFGYPGLFFDIAFVIIFINSIYQPSIPSQSFSKWAFSLLNRIHIWTFGFTMVSIKQIVWEPMKFRIIYLTTSHEQSSCRLLEEKQNVHIFIQAAKQRKWKNIEKRGCRVVFRTLSNIYDGAFLRKYNG